MRQISLEKVCSVFIFLCISLIIFSGCASQGKASASAPKDAGRATDAIAAAVAGVGAGSGSLIDVVGSSFGSGRAAIGDSYLSAVGVPCRPVIFVNEGGDRYNLAVCAEKDGLWATAPHIFASNKYPG